MVIFVLLLFFSLSPAGFGAGAYGHVDQDDECKPAKCGQGPEIRFPFWLKDHQPDRCGYGPGFALTCSPTTANETLVDIPFSVKGVVTSIDYLFRYITYEFSSCFQHQNNLSLIFNSTSPFLSFEYMLYDSSDYVQGGTLCDYYVFSCPSSLADSSDYVPLPCLSRPGHYLMDWDYITPNLLNCTKMYTIPSVPCICIWHLPDGHTASWDEPRGCRECEATGKYCRLNSTNSSKKHETECYDIHKPPTAKPPTGETKSKHGETKSPLVTDLVPPGIFLFAVLVIATYFAYRSSYLKKEDQVKVERFLENYRALKPTRYTYAEIKKITQNFKDKLGQGGYGTVYKGELSIDVPIAAKILNNFTGNGDDFINEVGTIGTIHHINVVRLVGYCADGYKKALVYEYLPNDSLDKFISSDHKKASLGWEKLQDIALGIAKGIEYLHQGNFGNVSHKSDVYSFGMLLLEMVGGRKKNIDVREENNTEEVYFPEWIYNRLNREESNDNEVEEGGDAKIIKKLTIVGLWCIQWYPGDRPSMKTVVQMLEGDEETLAMPPNPFSTTNQKTTRGKMGERPFSSMLEIISESD
ncbi:hypothetical protein Vadar_009160 [Vaccinium darrowii]|uniref:Uncharacterized protein n=1 Tax=Vaccinium darrowii TaxID=229202 RepID=A0ACB7Z2P1_9ERIC|nr:hypothetical protein Vadar_009160 [Vaccinium darrowii]